MKRCAIAAFTAAGAETGSRVAAYLRETGMHCDCYASDRVTRQQENCYASDRVVQQENCHASDRVVQQEIKGSGGEKLSTADRDSAIELSRSEKMPEAADFLTMEGGLSAWAGHAFEHYDLMVFVSAMGIAVRAIAPYIRDKFKDPAVLVLDEAASFVIPVLSGHVGGANHYARLLAAHLGAQAVLTTATDVRGKFAVDVFAVGNRLKISSRRAAKEISAELLQGKEKSLYINEALLSQTPEIPEIYRDQLILTHLPEQADIRVDYRTWDSEDIRTDYRSCAPGDSSECLRLIPRDVLWLGIGCKKGSSREAIEAAVESFMTEHGLAGEAVAGLASVDLKAGEAGICQTAEAAGWPFVTFTPEDLAQVPGEFTASAFVKARVGVDNVCERATLLAAMRSVEIKGEDSGAVMICRKQNMGGITLAAALTKRRIRFE